MKPKSRLGRGLSSLITSTEPDAPASPAAHDVQTSASLPQVEAAAAASTTLDQASSAQSDSSPADQILQLPIGAISANPHQPRRQFDEERLAELAASFKTTGIIQPVIVRRVGDEYQLIAGERRWRAAQHAGLSAIPAILRSVDSAAQAQMALVENIQREDLNPLDRALAYREMMEKLSLTQNELAARLGENRSGIAHFLRLLDLHAEVQEMIRAGVLQVGHGKLLASVEDLELQLMLAKKVADEGWSVRELERQLEVVDKAPDKPSDQPKSSYLVSLSEQIGRAIGLRVQMAASKKGKGRVVIHYGSNEQFDQLMRRLGVSIEE